MKQRFLLPYRQGLPIIISGKTIRPDDIEKITITSSEQNSQQLLPIVEQERRASGVISFVPNEWFIAQKGADVTDELILGPPGYEANINTTQTKTEVMADSRIFIGHGHSTVWKDLKDFLQDRLKLKCEEFNREPTAGFSTKERLEAMLNNSSFAFIVMTAEDEHVDNMKHARENVVHEAGLFQGKLGFKRAIILLEEGCTEFSNISGVGQIRFPAGNVGAKYEEIRRVLEREGVISS